MVAAHLARAEHVNIGIEKKENDVYDTIIVALDGGPYAERALGPASQLARRLGAALVPMTVVDQAGYEDRLRYAADVAERLDVPTRRPYVLVSRDPAECIANAGEADGALVVITSHARSGPSHLFLGSVTDAVVRTLERPVLVIGRSWDAGATWPRGPVVVPVDGSENAERIMPAVRAWCTATKAEAWPVTVIDPQRASNEGMDTGYVRQVAANFEEAGVHTGWEVLHESRTADAITTFAAGRDADLIAMTTHGRTGLARVTMGSVAARVLHEARCPVLLLRPNRLDADGG
jgi:nucleotide-binding universal stress UspA family protein